ncbi:MAG TPA: pyruvate kinase [Acidimicrobiales bacterium]
MALRTKIVATLGPATPDRAHLEALLRAGVDVVRLNLSHGPVEDHLRRLAEVREVAAGLDRPIGVLADLPGPKIRAGSFPEGGVDLAPGARVHLVPGDGPSTEGVVSVGYAQLLDDVDRGDRVVIGDGAITMRVVETDASSLGVVVESGGHAQGRPGVHLSGERLQMSAPTGRDRELAAAITGAGVDYVGLSFVRRAGDVVRLRKVVGARVGIVAKVETASALGELAAISEVADAVMVARGDLGIDCPLEDVPHLQKQIIRHCVSVGTPVITATQMLETMVSAPAPTRAEVSDVANAVFDGTDALMLSAETAIGHDPVLVVETMARIAARAEVEASYRHWAAPLGREQRSWEGDGDDRMYRAVSHAAWQVAHDAGASAILCCTRTGRTARAIARFRPECRLVGLSPDPRTLNALSLSWGVESLPVEEYTTTDELIWFAVETALRHGCVSHGDIVIVLAGTSDHPTSAAPDVLRIVQVT